MRSSNHFACLLSVDKEFVEKCMLYVHLDALSIKGQFFLKNEDHASAQSYFTMALHDVLQNTAYEDEFQEVRIHLKIQLDSVRLIIADNRATFSVDQPIKIDENMPESAKAVFSSDGLDSFFDKKGFVLGG
jgi:signal transduction histidine kinase